MDGLLYCGIGHYIAYEGEMVEREPRWDQRERGRKRGEREREPWAKKMESTWMNDQSFRILTCMARGSKWIFIHWSLAVHSLLNDKTEQIHSEGTYRINWTWSCNTENQLLLLKFVAGCISKFALYFLIRNETSEKVLYYFNDVCISK